MRMNFNVLLFYFNVLEIINSGEKLQNAFLYAIFEESFDLDHEIFNV